MRRKVPSRGWYLPELGGVPVQRLGEPVTVKVVKGAVVVGGDVSADIVPLLIAKAKTRTRLEVWRASLPDMDFLSDLTTIEHLSIVHCKVVDSSALPDAGSIRSLFINGSTFRQGLGFIASMEGLEALHLLNLRGSVTVPEAQHAGPVGQRAGVGVLGAN